MEAAGRLRLLPSSRRIPRTGTWKMATAPLSRWPSLLLCVATLLLLACGPSWAQAPAPLDLSTELVDPQVLRVCADPHNLPFSNDKGEGFENKLAELVAAKLGKPLAYTWYPQSVGFVRNTLAAHRCDVIMGFP